jgi:N utilization substance protein B
MAVKVLYQADLSGVTIAEAFQLFCAHFGGPEENMGFAKELLDGVNANLEQINRLISKFSENWRIERMSLVDRNVLRLAIYEIVCRRDIPAKVSINEAVEIGKKFGSEESGAFINGILDRIRSQVRGEEEKTVPDGEGTTPGQAGPEPDGL